MVSYFEMTTQYVRKIVFSQFPTYSTKDQFNDWGGRGCNIFIPVFRGNGTKIAPTEDIFDQPPGQMR